MGSAAATPRNKPLVGITCRTHVVPPKAEGRNSSIGFLGQKPYVDSILRAGGVPVLLPSVENDGYVEVLLRTLDGILLTGGHDADPALYGEEPHPKLGLVDDLKARFEVRLIQNALGAGLPILAICGGLQALNIACGGTLHQDIASCTGSTMHHHVELSEERPCHTIEIVAGSRLHAILRAGQIRVNSRHHQCVNKLGERLQAVAQAPDGVIEAIERPAELFVLGVQFHPENLAPHDPMFQNLFNAFVEACRGTRAPTRAEH